MGEVGVGRSVKLAKIVKNYQQIHPNGGGRKCRQWHTVDPQREGIMDVQNIQVKDGVATGCDTSEIIEGVVECSTQKNCQAAIYLGVSGCASRYVEQFGTRMHFQDRCQRVSLRLLDVSKGKQGDQSDDDYQQYADDALQDANQDAQCA